MPRCLRWSAYSLRTKVLVVVLLPVLPLTVFWSLTTLTLVRRGAPGDDASVGLASQAALARVFSILLDADAGARDHLLTDNPRALARYEEAVARLPAELETLDRVIVEGHLRASLEQLQEIVADELAVLRRIAYGQSPAEPRIGERAALDLSALHLERIREVTATMQHRQGALVAAWAFRSQIAGTVFAWALLIGSVLCAGGGVAAAVLVAGSVARRVAIVAANADRLARGAALHAPPLGEDEIGQLDRRFREASRLLRLRGDELRARSAEIEAANAELEAFSYSVSHDLRAPLRTIAGFSEIIDVECGDRLDDTGRDALNRVRQAAARMDALIDALLDLSRLTRTEFERRPIDVSAAASAIVEDLSSRRRKRHVAVSIEPGLTVDADPHLVRIALENLIGNAWKYSSKRKRPHIEVGSTPNGSARVFHVRDNGVGFDMRHADKLFGPFQRLHADREFQGTGIGLAIVQRVVHRHGGKIWADGEVNRGATFYFTLAPEGPHEASQDEGRGAHASGVRSARPTSVREPHHA